MARIREVGTLWIGNQLGWMEQLCLKSFVDQGQKITLFSYATVENVPAGVVCRDGREVLQTETFLTYDQKDSYALFADLFRLHMLQCCPGMIWVDTDVYCHRVMDYDDDYLFGRELDDRDRLNNAVLALPAASAVLADMLAYTGDPFAVPPFVKANLRQDYAKAKAAGQPVHVSQQPRGVWGPLLVTHFVKKHGLMARAQPVDVFYPVTFPHRIQFLKAERKAAGAITARTTAMHLWASNEREHGNPHNGRPREGSYLAMLLEKHGIVPDDAPILTRGKREFDAGLLEATGLSDIARFADVSGGGLALALAAHAKFDCSIALVDLDKDGRFPAGQSDWIAPYQSALAAAGVPPGHIRIVQSEAGLQPADLICNLSGFGDRFKVKHLAPVLDRCLHSDSRLVTDIRKGSGSFPFLARYGEIETLLQRQSDGKPLSRVMLRPRAPEPVVNDDDWASIATSLAGPQGFYRANDAHSFLYIPRGPTLVVTFDNLDIAMGKREDRRPWGFSFIEKQGWSMLGVMANGWTWYRDRWVSDEFDRLAAIGFFAGFGRVVFYGASMGAYAACAFSGSAPGADVVAISPQSTVDKAVVPWETRYKTVWGADFSGKYGDAALVSGAARRVTILYDPYEQLDAGHADRFSAANVMKLRANLMGHRLGSSLLQMGILHPIILAALNGTLSEAEFYRVLRARHSFPRYQRELMQRLMARGHTELARRLGQHLLAKGDNRAIRGLMQGLGR